MNETSPERAKRSSNLTAAIRAARVDEAERSQALGDLHGAELARLELLKEALDPVLAQIPAEIDLFDTGIVPGAHPRLFVDMISFVEMGRDRRTYRFLQDTRNGRVLLAEADGVAAVLEAVTQYIARRLVEREKALAALPPNTAAAESGSAEPAELPRPVPFSDPAASPARSGLARGLRRTLAVLGDFLSLAALITLVWIAFRLFGGHLPHG